MLFGFLMVIFPSNLLPFFSSYPFSNFLIIAHFVVYIMRLSPKPSFACNFCWEFIFPSLVAFLVSIQPQSAQHATGRIQRCMQTTPTLLPSLPMIIRATRMPMRVSAAGQDGHAYLMGCVRFISRKLITIIEGLVQTTHGNAKSARDSVFSRVGFHCVLMHLKNLPTLTTFIQTIIQLNL